MIFYIPRNELAKWNTVRIYADSWQGYIIPPYRTQNWDRSDLETHPTTV